MRRGPGRPAGNLKFVVFVREAVDRRRSQHPGEMGGAGVRRDEQARSRDRAFPGIEIVEAIDGDVMRVGYRARLRGLGTRHENAQRLRASQTCDEFGKRCVVQA